MCLGSWVYNDNRDKGDMDGMKEDTDVQRPLRVAVIGRDGVIEYRQLAMSEPLSGQGNGKVVFPFENTSVHSDAWKASDHVRLLKKGKDQ